MKEKIYTIPVTDAFRTECECPLCTLERNLELETIEYVLGPSLMEPDGRNETNDKGFCSKHYEMSFNRQESKLGLGLIMDTHYVTQIDRLRDSFAAARAQEAPKGVVAGLRARLGKNEGTDPVNEAIQALDKLIHSCEICNRLDKTMERYLDVIYWLYFKESDFRSLFLSKKGFCLPHLRLLLDGTRRYLNPSQAAEFVPVLLDIQLQNMERIQSELSWFTKKFDYRYQNEPWNNSKDAVPRSIQKMAGNCQLKS